LINADPSNGQVDATKWQIRVKNGSKVTSALSSFYPQLLTLVLTVGTSAGHDLANTA
jgi:hypothetical protein